MDTKKLNAIITSLAHTMGITKYRIERMELKDDNYNVTSNGELVYDRIIEVKILPTEGYFEIPITFNIKREENES